MVTPLQNHTFSPKLNRPAARCSRETSPPYRGESDASLRIALSLQQNAIAVLYEDSAPRYDPRAQLPGAPTGIERSLESRAIGGLGVYLVGRLIEGASYAYQDGCNRAGLTMQLAKHAMQG